MSNFLKILILLAVVVPPVMFFINWSVDKSVKNAVKEASISSAQNVQDLFAAKCALCHGANADGSQTYPALNKFTKDQLIEKLKKHKNVDGGNQIMKMQAGSLTDAQIESVAGFISTLKPTQNTQAPDKQSENKKSEMKLDNSGGKD